MKTLPLALLLTATLHGAILTDKGTPQFPTYNATDFENADDFTFSSAHSILAVRFWGESIPNSPISYRIYDNGASGAPGNLLASGGVTPTASSFASGFVLDFNLVTPLSLNPGTYYLSLHDGPYGTSSGAGFFWFSSGPGLHFQQTNAISTPPAEPQTGNEMAFQLFDTQFVPEPGSAWLAAGGVAWILLRRLTKLYTI